MSSRVAFLVLALSTVGATPCAAQTIVQLVSGLNEPVGLAQDSSKNLFIADSGDNTVKEALAASGYTTVRTLGTGFTPPYSIAIDRSHNLFVSDGTAIKEIPAAGGYTTVKTLGSGFNKPSGIAVDGNGNVFVADTYNDAVKEILAAGGYTTVVSLGSGFKYPVGVALDAAGNLFVTDTGNDAVKELPAAGGYASVETLVTNAQGLGPIALDQADNIYVGGSAGVSRLQAAGGYATSTFIANLPEPTGIAVDGAGNVFVSDLGQNVHGFFPLANVTEVLAASQYMSTKMIEYFSSPAGVALDASGNVYVADYGGDAVTEIEATGGYTTSTPLIAGFDGPAGIAVDSAGNVFVTDSDGTLKELPAASGYAAVATIASGLFGPSGVAVDAADNVFVADTLDNAVREFLAAGGYATVQILSGTWQNPTDLASDGSGHLFVADGHGLNELSAADDYASVKVLGHPEHVGGGFAFDGAGNLITGHMSEWLAAGGYTTAYLLYPPGTIGVSGIVLDGQGNIIGTSSTGVEKIIPSPASPLVASVLPGARAVGDNATPTIFATMINAGAAALDNCQISLPSGTPAGLTLNYQTTDPTTNALTGSPDTPVTIAGNNGIQTFLLAFRTPGFVDALSPIVLNFTCDGVPPAPTLTDINTVSLTISTEFATVDAIALAATPTNNGILEIPQGGAAAFGVASINLGSTDSVTVSVDTGTTALPAAISLCQTDPSTAQCLATPAASVSLSYPGGAAETFSVFVQSTGPIALAPAQSRVFVRFTTNSLHVVAGLTSVAIETQ